MSAARSHSLSRSLFFEPLESRSVLAASMFHFADFGEFARSEPQPAHGRGERQPPEMRAGELNARMNEGPGGRFEPARPERMLGGRRPEFMREEPAALPRPTEFARPTVPAFRPGMAGLIANVTANQAIQDNRRDPTPPRFENEPPIDFRPPPADRPAPPPFVPAAVARAVADADSPLVARQMAAMAGYFASLSEPTEEDTVDEPLLATLAQDVVAAQQSESESTRANTLEEESPLKERDEEEEEEGLIELESGMEAKLSRGLEADRLDETGTLRQYRTRTNLDRSRDDDRRFKPESERETTAITPRVPPANDTEDGGLIELPFQPQTVREPTAIVAADVRWEAAVSLHQAFETVATPESARETLPETARSEPAVIEAHSQPASAPSSESEAAPELPSWIGNLIGI